MKEWLVEQVSPEESENVLNSRSAVGWGLEEFVPVVYPADEQYVSEAEVICFIVFSRERKEA